MRPRFELLRTELKSSIVVNRGAESHSMSNNRRKRHIFLVLCLAPALIACAVTTYVLYWKYFDPGENAHGWHMKKKFVWITLEPWIALDELSFEGKPIMPPSWRWVNDDGHTPIVSIQTPVGTFDTYSPKGWTTTHQYPTPLLVNQDVSANELIQGWYDATPADTTALAQGQGPYIRKQNTPAHWCLLATYDVARWVDPMVIDKLKW